MSREFAPAGEVTADGLLDHVRSSWLSLVAWLVLVVAVGAAVHIEFPAAGRTADAPVFVLDINRATAGQFEALPNLGPVMAQRIVRVRQQRGAFRSVDELLLVHGFGPKTLERLRPHLRCGPIAADASRIVPSRD